MDTETKKHMLSGISFIAISSAINKIIAFLSNVLIVRIVTQTEYGLYTSAYNVITIVMLFTGLGTLDGVLQYGSEKRDDSEKYRFFKFAFGFGILFDLILVFGVYGYALLKLSPIIGTEKFIYILAPTIIFHYIFEYYGVLLRTKKDNKHYAILLNVNSITFSLLSCLGTYFFGVVGLAVGRNISYILGIVMGIIFNRKLIRPIAYAEKITFVQKKEMILFSLACCVSSALNRLLYVLDIFIVGYIIKDANQVAIYKVGATIPEALEFIPQSVMIAMMPYFASHNSDINWLRKWTKKLYLFSGLLNVFISTILFIFAPFIVNLLWKQDYASSVPIFRILAINYFVMATFRQVGTNILITLRKNRYNVVISCITCLANVIIDILFVYFFGINGAAFATLIVVILASLLSFPYVIFLIYNKKSVLNLIQKEDSNFE